MNTRGCPFCDHVLARDDPELATELAVAFDDAFPVGPGHMLIIPRRHVSRFAELTPDERHAMWGMVPAVCKHVESLHDPAGYTIGLNDGEAAGQTVLHVHLHVIPRYEGDSQDPRGGIRWVVPERAAYWEHTDE